MIINVFSKLTSREKRSDSYIHVFLKSTIFFRPSYETLTAKIMYPFKDKLPKGIYLNSNLNLNDYPNATVYVHYRSFGMSCIKHWWCSSIPWSTCRVGGNWRILTKNSKYSIYLAFRSWFFFRISVFTIRITIKILWSALYLNSRKHGK